MIYHPYPRRRRVYVRTAYVLLRRGYISYRTFAMMIRSVMEKHR